MSRTEFAFIVAPLWVPVALMIEWSLLATPPDRLNHWILVAGFGSLAIGYAGTFLFGVPAFLFLQSRNWTARWIGVVLGFAVAVTTLFVFNALFALALGYGVRNAVLGALSSFSDWRPWITAGPIGSLVGVTLWLIARPDRS
jgi:hypothetical protein